MGVGEEGKGERGYSVGGGVSERVDRDVGEAPALGVEIGVWGREGRGVGGGGGGRESERGVEWRLGS